jgi:hypothetical protein
MGREGRAARGARVRFSEQVVVRCSEQVVRCLADKLAAPHGRDRDWLAASFYKSPVLRAAFRLLDTPGK